MILFGWGHQMRKDFGPVFQNHCAHCNNDEYWTLHRISVWFTLFFIPVFPYEWKYVLLCPICTYGIELDSNQINQLKPIAANNSALIKGKISEKEYGERTRLLEGGGDEQNVEKKQNVMKEKERKSKQKEIEQKEVRLTLKIGDHDLSYKAKQARTFVDRGDKVKVSMRLRGRENAFAEQALGVFDKFAATSGLLYESRPRKMGNMINAQVLGVDPEARKRENAEIKNTQSDNKEG